MTLTIEQAYQWLDQKHTPEQVRQFLKSLSVEDLATMELALIGRETILLSGTQDREARISKRS